MDYPDGTREEWTRDNHGNTLVYTSVRGAETRYKYDAADRVIQAYLPDGNTVDYGYDSAGNLQSVKYLDSHAVTRCNLFGDMTERTDSAGRLRFAYDTEGRLTVVINEDCDRYQLHRDSEGDLVKETGFDGVTREYERDYTGRVLSMTVNGRHTTGYGYDDFGRLTRITRPGGGEETFDYDLSGLLRKAVNSDAEVCFERDIAGRIVRESCNGHVTESVYDLQGRRTRLTSSPGADIEAAYNPFGDLENIAAQGWEAALRHDSTGLETERLLPGGLTRRTAYDRPGRVTARETLKNLTAADRKEYLWGRSDRLLSVTGVGGTQSCTYDRRGFLTQTQYADGTTEIRVPDHTGNLYEALNRGDRKYGVGGRLVKTEQREYKYDDRGNMVRKRDRHGATWRYEWNDAGMLAKVKRPDAREVLFKYDALGRRIEKEFGTIITYRVWDGNVPLHEQRCSYSRAWDAEKKLVYWAEEKLPLITWVFEEGTFVPAAKIRADQRLSIVSDYMGTPEAMYREDGEKVWTCELNSYGKVRSFKGQSKTDCPFRYQGQYEDAETGLYYNRFRYYSPDEGMYISQDPIRFQKVAV
jgi:RHS repeat-associated protein